MSRRVATLFLLVFLTATFSCSSASFASDEADASPVSPEEVTKDEATHVDEEYFDLFMLVADTIDQIERNYVKTVDRRELFEAAIRGLTSELDPYSNYIPPEEIDNFRSSIDSEFGGIGIQVTVERGQLTIISPLVGTPAYRGGLLAGDRIIEIEGETTDGISLNEAVRRMKGKIGTDVTITVRHAHGGEAETVTLTRELIRIETVLGDRRNEDDRWDFMYDDQEKIAYIRLTAFSRHTARDLRRTLSELKLRGMRGLVLDLRFNPGGLLSSAVEVSDMFISSGVIVSTEGRNTKKKVWSAQQSGTFQGFSMVVLVNGFSASASEIVSACLQDHGRALIIGQRTWGKGSVQNVVELEDGHSALKLTTAGYQRPNGKNIHRFYDSKDDDEWGVKPDEDYEIEYDAKATKAYLDYRRQRDIVPARQDESVDKDVEGDPSDESDESSESKDNVESGEDGTDVEDGTGTDVDGSSESNDNVESPEAGEDVGEEGADNEDTEQDEDGKVNKDGATRPSEKQEDGDTSEEDADHKKSAEQDLDKDENDKDEKKDAAQQSPYVDRQLEMALKYLRDNMDAYAKK